MKILLLIFTCGLFQMAYSQCNVTANASITNITCGQSVILSHNGSTQGNLSFTEDFNNQSTSGWAFTQQATFTNPCSPNGVDGTPHIWMGAQSGVPRTLETNPLNFGPAIAPAGGTICFDLLFAAQGQSSPCEGPDEADEGVYLQYSIDNGATWQTIHYFNPNGGNDPQLVNWNNWCFPIPAAALTNNVKFRWFQDADSGAEYDHWGIDNVKIIVNDPNVVYTWSHDGYTTSLPGDNPNAVTPQTTTTYTVTMTTSSGNCTSNITIVVNSPNIIVNAGLDQQICSGDCVNLQGSATVIADSGGIKTYANNQVEDFSAGLFNSGSVNVNVQGLNMDNINPGSIQKICISNLTFTGFNLPPSGVETLSLTLECPGGATVVLVPQGGAPAGAGFLNSSYYQNVCFVPSGGSNLSAVLPANASPISGNFAPNQPFSNLDGCLSNGTWTISVTSNALTGDGTFDGWSITFDDEIDEYTPNFTWSPTTFITPGEETTFTPNICPTQTTTYTLAATDTAGCLTVTDDVTITITNCCNLQIDNIQTITPTCGNSNGKITILYSGETTGIKFSIDNGVTFQNSNVFDNLPSGTYQVTITDDAGCPVNQTVNLTNANAPVIDDIVTSDATCGNSDGSINVTASGGNGTLTYSSNNGTSFQNGNVFSNLPAGSYTVIVKDADGCEVSQTAQITTPNAPVIDAVNTTNPDCGATNGAITINVSGGTLPYSYSIDNGANFQAGNNFTNLSPGSYAIVVKDDLGCEATQQVSLNTTSVPTIIAGANQTICAGESITLTATGGVSYVWSNGVTNGQSFTPTVTTTYTVTGTDANGCTATSTVTITVNPIPTANFTADVMEGDPVLEVEFTNTSTGATGYIWDFGNGSNPITTGSGANQNGTFTNPGVYTVELTATNGNCTDSFSMPITVFGLPGVEIYIPNVFTPDNNKVNDEFFIDVKNGKTIQVVIYNRWGNVMYQISDFKDKWNGGDATDGVYFFTYEITDIQDKVHIGHGHVTLKR